MAIVVQTEVKYYWNCGNNTIIIQNIFFDGIHVRTSLGHKPKTDRILKNTSNSIRDVQ